MRSKFAFLRFLVFIFCFFGLVCKSAGENKFLRSLEDNREDTGESESDSKEDDSSVENEGVVSSPVLQNSGPRNESCSGRRQGSRVHEIKNAVPGQFPFMAAVMTHQNEYLCSGSVVSNGMVLTTAECLQQAVSHVLINITRATRSDDSIVLVAIRTEAFPSFGGSDLTKNVGIVFTEKANASDIAKIKLSDYTSNRNVYDLEAIGFGLNADIGRVRELQYVGLEHRPVFDDGDIMKGIFDCVDTKVLTCFRDSGSPVLFDNELVGIVVKGQDVCTKEITSVYSVNKVMADILPTYTFKAWLDDQIKKNENLKPVAVLATFPERGLGSRNKTHMMTSIGGGAKQLKAMSLCELFIICVVVCFAEF